VGERDVLLELRETRRVMIEELMQRLKDGKITARNLESQRRSAFRGGRKARNRVRRVLVETGNAGMGHVLEELSRG